MTRIEWRERDGRHVSYVDDERARVMLEMIAEDDAMTLVES